MVRTIQIDDFCETGTGGTPSRAKLERYYEGGTIPWVKSGELRESVIVDTEEHLTEYALRESNAKIVPAGSLLLAMYGATVGRVGVLGVPATTNQAVCHIIPDPRMADRQYLFWALRASLPDLLSQRVGGAQPNISQSIIRRLGIRLPPLPEQRRIADILDRAEALRAKRRVSLTQLDALVSAIFLQMFGDPVLNPRLYPTNKLIELMDHERGISYGVVQRGENDTNGVPVLRIGDIVGGELVNDKVKFISKAVSGQYKRTILRGGEIVISIRGSVGRCAVVPKMFAGGNISRELALLPPNPNISVSFLLNLLRSEPAQSSIAGNVKGVAQRGINLEDLRDFPVLQPSAQEIAEFETRLQAIDRLKAKHRQSLAEMDALFQSLQHRAFRGEL